MSLRNGCDDPIDDRAFALFDAEHGRLVFSAIAPVRLRVYHGGDQAATCRNLAHACHECTDLQTDVMRSLFSTVAARLDDASFAPTRYLRAAARGRAEGILQERATKQGMAAKPARDLATALWVTKHLPLRGQPDVLLRMVHYVRSSDRPEAGSDYPVRRFADELMLDLDFVARQVIEIPLILKAVSLPRAVWVATNLTEPLARKQERHDAVPLEDFQPWADPTASAWDRPVEDAVMDHLMPREVGGADAGEHADQVREIECVDDIIRAGRGHLAAQRRPDPVAALLAGAREVLPSGQAEALEAHPDLVQLGRDLLAS